MGTEVTIQPAPGENVVLSFIDELRMQDIHFIYLFIFDMDLFKVFIEFFTTLLLFNVLVLWPRGMWDLSSPTRDRAHTLFIGTQ